MSNPGIRKPSPALLIAIIALFVGLGGGAYAASSIGKNQVGTKQLKANAVGTKQLKSKAVGTKQLKSKAVGFGKLKDNSVPTSKLDDMAVTSDKLDEESVIPSKISDGAVKSSQLGGTVTMLESTTVQPMTTASVSVSCDPGDRILLGGYEAPPVVQPNSSALLPISSNKDGEGWKVSAYNIGNQPGELKVFAHCLTQ
jgi:hypothetical protein